MKCRKCGHDNPAFAGFCEKCGTKLKEKKRIPPRYLAVVGGAAAAVVLIAGIGSWIGQTAGADRITYKEHDIVLLYDDRSDMTDVVIDGKPADSILNGKVYAQESSFDGSSAAIVMNDSTLYSVTAENVIKVADDVEKAVISANGASIGYANEEGEVYYYNVKQKKSTRMVSADITEPGITVSPDGKTFGISDLDAGHGWIYRIGKEPENIDGHIVAVSDKGKHIYTIKKDGSLNHVNSKGETEKITSDPDYIIFNRDNTRLLFGADSKLFYIPDEEEKYRLMNAYGFYILSSHDIITKTNVDSGYIQYSPYEDFTDEVYCTYDADSYTYSIVYLNENCGVSEIASGIGLADFAKFPQITDDKKNIYYIKSDALYVHSMDFKKKDDVVVESVKIANEVLDFAVSDDGKYVYYLNEEDELRCLIDGKTDRKIMDGATSLYMTNGDTLLFMTEEDGMLYSCGNGKRVNTVSDDVYGVYTYAGTTFYYEDYDNGEVDICVSTDGKKFREILTDTYAK